MKSKARGTLTAAISTPKGHQDRIKVALTNPKVTLRSRAKAGTSQEAAAARRKAFVRAYTSNGRNGTQAAIAAGYSPKTARAAASRLLTDVNVAALVETATARVEEITGLSAERAAALNANIAKFDVRKLVHPNGKPKALHELDEETAMVVTVTPGGVAAADRQRAMDMAFKNLGLYEKDHAQRGENLVIQVNLVGK